MDSVTEIVYLSMKTLSLECWLRESEPVCGPRLLFCFGLSYTSVWVTWLWGHPLKDDLGIVWPSGKKRILPSSSLPVCYIPSNEGKEVVRRAVLACRFGAAEAKLYVGGATP